ncbi:putative Cytochrome P450 [Seiridium cardinale]
MVSQTNVAATVTVPEPYSFLFGHISLMKLLKQGLPSDAHDTYVVRKLSLEWQDYFPNATKAPPLAYLDLWPFLSQPLIVVFSPQACSQLTQETPQPRHSLFRWSLTPLTGGNDLTSVDMATHRVWRSRLNPGFSLKNLILQMDVLLEEVAVFAEKLRNNAGDNGTWGDVFTLYDNAVSLTFDIIFRSALNFRANEQTQGPGPLFKSIRRLTTYVKKPNLITKLERCLPAYRHDVSHHGKVVNDILKPEIQARLDGAAQTSRRKTVVDLALQHIPAESDHKTGLRQRSEYIDVVLSQLKVFILAGHHTTAQAMQNPGVLRQIQTEHDQVLGSDPGQATEVLSKQPHTLNDLRYTTAVIKESLRVHALGQTHREGSTGFNFSIEEVIYPTYDTIIQTVPAATQSHPDLWPRVKEFLPERFLVTDGHPLYPLKNAWRTFELGSTRCIGEELAMMEIKLVLVFTLRELEFEFPSAGWDEPE